MKTYIFKQQICGFQFSDQFQFWTYVSTIKIRPLHKN